MPKVYASPPVQPFRWKQFIADLASAHNSGEKEPKKRAPKKKPERG